MQRALAHAMAVGAVSLSALAPAAAQVMGPLEERSVVGQGQEYQCRPEGDICCQTDGWAHCTDNEVVCEVGVKALYQRTRTFVHYVCVTGELVGQGKEYYCGPLSRPCCSAEGRGAVCDGAVFQCTLGEKRQIFRAYGDYRYACIL